MKIQSESPLSQFPQRDWILRRVIGLFLALGIIAAQFYFFRRAGSLTDQLQHPTVGTASAFGALITVAVVCLIPTGPLTLGSGLVLGVPFGGVTVLAGMTLGSGISFLLARFVLSGWAERVTGQHPKLNKLREVVADDGWRLVFLIRLIPMFPSKLVNYVFGISGIRFIPYLIASCLGYIPNTLAAVYSGSLAGSAMSNDDPLSAIDWIVRGLGLIGIFGFIFLITRNARRFIGDRFEKEEPS